MEEYQRKEQALLRRLEGDLHPANHKIRITYTDREGTEQAITCLYLFLVTTPETAMTSPATNSIKLVAIHQEELDLLLVQNYETLWAVYATLFHSSMSRLNAIEEHAESLVRQNLTPEVTEGESVFLEALQRFREAWDDKKPEGGNQ